MPGDRTSDTSTCSLTTQLSDYHSKSTMTKRIQKVEESEKGSHKKNQVSTKLMILIRTHATTAISIEAKYRTYHSEHPGRHSEHLIDTSII